MREIWDKIKKIFKDKLNAIAFSLVVLFIIMIVLPIDNEIYSRISMLVLAGALIIVAYKFYLRHKEMKDVYDNLDSVRQEKKESSFSQLSNKIEKAGRFNNITYALVFGAIAILIVIYVLFK